MKKLIALLLVILMALTLVGCNKDNDTETGGDELSYDEQSAAIYDAQLGEFYDTYMAAKENASTISERYALMAVAEAKLMEIYKPFNLPIVSVSRRSAEMIKYASNDFLALKISYMNYYMNV